MVKAKRKPLEEIADAISAYGKVLTVGCGGCVSVCLAGGQREVYELNAELELKLKESGASKQLGNYTVERQCNMDLIQEMDDIAEGYDCILSMACGAGVQLMAERYPDKPVFPAVNTVFIGVDRGLGMYEEKCRACGECVLAYTGGICPVSRCAKGLFNGPCGGTNNRMCEVSQEVPCAWLDIYERLKAQDRLDDILKLQSVMQWQNQLQRTVVQPKYEKRYYK